MKPNLRMTIAEMLKGNISTASRTLKASISGSATSLNAAVRYNKRVSTHFWFSIYFHSLSGTRTTPPFSSQGTETLLKPFEQCSRWVDG